MLANWRRKLRLTTTASKGRSSGGRGLKPRFSPEVLMLEDRVVPSATHLVETLVYQPNATNSGAPNTQFQITAEDAGSVVDPAFTDQIRIHSSDPLFNGGADFL